MIRVFAFITFLSPVATPVLAQTHSVGADQLGSPTQPGNAAVASQIGASSRVLPSAPPPDRSLLAGGPTQSLSTAPPQPIGQLTDQAPEASASAGAQLSRSGPSVEAPASGTQRSQGRDTRADALEGKDRCDPRLTKAEGAGELCESVIETRADQFTAPEINPLSPEQRLMVSQRELDERTRGLGDAVRRLGNGTIDSESAAIAVASLSMNPAASNEEELPADAESSAMNAVISAIVEQMGVVRP